MYRILLVLICLIMGCQPLRLPTETKDQASAEDNTLKPILIEPGQTREIQFLKGQLAHQVLQLPELIEGQFYIIHLVALNYESGELIQPARNNDTGFSLQYALNNDDSDIPFMFEPYLDQKSQRCAYIAFKAYQNSTAYLSMFYNFDNYIRNSEIVIKTSLATSRIDEQETNLPDSLKPGDSYTGVFTENNYEENNRFSLTNFEDNSWHKLIVKADLTHSLFPNLVDQNFNTAMPYGYDDVIFIDSNTHIYYFKPDANSNPCVISINGQIGVAYTLSLLKVPNSISSDSYEPDNGPISPNMDRITGTDVQSYSHSFIASESDWIQFTPTEWGVYLLDLTIEDSFIEPGLELKQPPSIDFEIIRPDGATIEYNHNQRLLIKEKLPITFNNLFNWKITADQLSPWFIHLHYRSYGENPLPIEYSIKIHSETKP